MGRKRKTEQAKPREKFSRGEFKADTWVSESGSADEGRTWCADIVLSTVCGMLFFIVYYRTLHPSIAGGDSGELIVSAHEWGVAHPPGYPVFTLAAKAAMLGVPWGSLAFRVNLLTAGFSATAAALLHLTVLRLTACYGCGLLAAALFSLSELVWTWSVTAEVFGLNNLFIALLLLLSVIFDSTTEDRQTLKVAYVGAFTCGLSLCNQHTIVMYVVCIVLWVLSRLARRQLLSVSVLARLTTAFVVGLLPYAYLPISSWLHWARWTWGDHSTLSGFLTHLLRQEYGTFDLGKDAEGLGFSYAIKAYSDHLTSTFGIVGPPLAVAGVIFSLRRSLRGAGSAPVVFTIMFAVYCLFFSWRANLNIANPLFRGVVERFWMQSDIIVSLLCALGLHACLQFIFQKVFGKTNHPAKLLIALLCAIAVATLQIKRNFETCDQSNNFVVRDFARILLEKLPQNALVLTKGDLPTNSMRYLHLCENTRPDLQIVDQEVLTYEWSLPMLRHAFPKVIFPGDFFSKYTAKWEDGRNSFDFKTLLDTNFKRFSGVFACIGIQDHESSWTAGYNIWPYGPCKKVLPVHSTIDPREWANETGSFADQWTYPHDAFDERSWEKVANDEMWHAKIGAAFFLYQQGVSQKEKSVQASLFIPAYKLYKSAIKKNSDIGMPFFWHKNFALACEKLLYLEHTISKVKLTKESIKHFKKYSKLAADDSDLASITDAIKVLEQRLPVYEQLKAADTVTDQL